MMSASPGEPGNVRKLHEFFIYFLGLFQVRSANIEVYELSLRPMVGIGARPAIRAGVLSANQVSKRVETCRDDSVGGHSRTVLRCLSRIIDAARTARAAGQSDHSDSGWALNR
jgi:hypothetical protein